MRRVISGRLDGRTARDAPGHRRHDGAERAAAGAPVLAGRPRHRRRADEARRHRQGRRRHRHRARAGAADQADRRRRDARGPAAVRRRGLRTSALRHLGGWLSGARPAATRRPRWSGCAATCAWTTSRRSRRRWRTAARSRAPSCSTRACTAARTGRRRACGSPSTGLRDLDERLRERGGGLFLRRGDGVEEVARLAGELGARRVHACADDEPFARARDARAPASGSATTASSSHLHDDLTRRAARRRSPTATAARAARTRRTPAPSAACWSTGRSRPSATCSRAGCSRPTGRPRCPTPRRSASPARRPTCAAARRPASRACAAGGTAASADYAADARRGRRRPARPRGSRPYLKLGMLSPRRCLAVARRRRRPQVAGRAALARLVQVRPAPPSRPRGAQRRPALRAARVARDGRGLRGVVPWRDGLRARRRRDAAARRDRLAAEPRAHGLRELPGQGPARRLAPRRALLPRAPDRRRPLLERRQLAVGGGHRSRRRAVLPRLQPATCRRSASIPDGAYVRRWAPDRPEPIVDHDVERAPHARPVRRGGRRPGKVRQ